MRNIILASIVLLPAAARADRRIELGVALGAHAFSATSELGVPDDMSEPGPASSGLLGLRFALPLKPRLAIEAEAVVIPTHDDVLGESATVWGLHAHARFDLLTGRIKPFVVAGVGAQILRSPMTKQLDGDTDQAYHWGFGVRYALNDKLEARVDVRHLLVPDRTYGGATSELEVSAGMTYRFGGKRPAPASRRIELPGDRDGDNVPDDIDGCPEKPEDVDAFQDEDGCPDPDNDNDRIVDAADKCPLDAELVNGWQDDDGCPEKVIEELAGIGFEHNSARIDVESAPILERAVELLKASPAISIEISGHTSADGDPERNRMLSLDRAEAVKTYLVKRGIPAAHILTVGHGADEPVASNATEEGRIKNRRIEFRILHTGDLP